MGLETENPLEFLNQAKQALLDQRALSESLREAREHDESAGERTKGALGEEGKDLKESERGDQKDL